MHIHMYILYVYVMTSIQLKMSNEYYNLIFFLSFLLSFLDTI